MVAFAPVTTVPSRDVLRLTGCAIPGQDAWLAYSCLIIAETCQYGRASTVQRDCSVSRSQLSLHSHCLGCIWTLRSRSPRSRSSLARCTSTTQLLLRTCWGRRCTETVKPAFLPGPSSDLTRPRVGIDFYFIVLGMLQLVPTITLRIPTAHLDEHACRNEHHQRIRHALRPCEWTRWPHRRTYLLD